MTDRITHAQAVEAAKLARELIQQYVRPDYYHFLLDPVGQQTDPTKRAKEAIGILDAIISTPAPAPTVEPATAEKCRAFVDSAFMEFMNYETATQEEAGKTRLTAELLAMFAGMTGEDGEVLR